MPRIHFWTPKAISASASASEMHFPLITPSQMLLGSHKVKQPQSQRSDSEDKTSPLVAGIEKQCKLRGRRPVFLDSSWNELSDVHRLGSQKEVHAGCRSWRIISDSVGFSTCWHAKAWAGADLSTELRYCTALSSHPGPFSIEILMNLK